MNRSRTPGDDSPAREPKWRRYLRLLRADPVADLDDELRDHLESTIEALVARGSTPEAARAEALRRFGDVGRVRGEVRRLDHRHNVLERRLAALETFAYDIRHAVRGIRRSPVFAIVAVISIALGVAANTAVFSVVNALLLRPISGTHADGLMRIYVGHHSPFDWHDLAWFRANSRSFDYIVGERYGAMSFRAAPSDDAERVQTSYVTQGFFNALGVRMSAGRAFDVDEVSGAAEPVAVLSHAFWQRRFAGDSAVIGRTISVAEHRVTVVGVAAPDFHSSMMLWSPDVIVPFAIAPLLTGNKLDDFGGSFYVTAHLRNGVGPDAAQAELRGLMTQLAATDSVRYDRMTLRLDHVRGVNAEMRQAVMAGSAFFMAMVVMVLLIACANVANLLLGRAAARRTEIGVRLAIGASRGRLVRQLLSESFVLAVIGSVLGFACAWALTRILPAALPAEAGVSQDFFVPDYRVLLFTAALCLLTTLFFGAVPALRAASPDLVTLLKGDENRVHRTRRRGALVAVQAGMCVLLLAVALLFRRSLASMQSVDPGFVADGVVDVIIDLGLLGRGIDRPALFDRIGKAAGSIPGVQSAALTGVVPLSGSNMETRILPQGMNIASRHDYPSSYFNIITPRYFETLRTPILRGREFLTTDDASAPRVAVVNETAARRFWPGGEAIGKRFFWGGDGGPLVEVVGIVRDAAYVMPGESPKPTLYLPLAQEPRGEMVLQLRTAASVGDMRRAVTMLLHDIAPTLPPPPAVRMNDDMATTLLPVRAGGTLLGIFGVLALVLAAAAIYGVASYSVARRTREIGIRAALGATRARLVRMVLWESGRRVALGAGVGLVATIGAAAALSRVLYGVRALDPFVLLGVAAIMTTVAIIASLAPARRAANADPARAMRVE